MANIIMTIPNAFKSKAKKMSELVPTLAINTETEDNNRPTVGFSSAVPEDAETQKFVRRPLSGVAVKPGTHAYVQIVNAFGQPVRVFNQIGALHTKNPPPNDADANEPIDDYWTDWLLQTVQESRAEKTQIVETFGEPVFYAFGERPRVLQFQGILVNTADFNWRAEFWENWDRYFRATKLIENGWRLFLGFDDILVGGYPLNANAIQSTTQPNMVQFTFTMYVTNFINTTMLNIGLLQQNRLTIPKVGSSKTARLSEFIPQNSFKNPDWDQHNDQRRAGQLASIIGGQNLQFKESYAKIFGKGSIASAVGSSILDTATDVLFDPNLRHVRSAKAATDYLLTYLNKQALKASYMGMTELAKRTPGGQPGLTFWFGLVGQLYQQIGSAALDVLATTGLSSSTAKWGGLLERIFTVGNPYGVASYMGYAATAALGAGLRQASGELEVNGLTYDSRFGLVAKRQDPSFGAQISYRKDPEFNYESESNYRSILSARELTDKSDFPKTSYGSTGANQPIPGQFEEDQQVSATGSSQLDGLNRYLGKKSSEQELAAVTAQARKRQVNHGALTVVDSKGDIEDDGVEED